MVSIMPPAPESKTVPRAILTTYRGCRFRSRLEARWAIFLDHAGIGWEYEAQGYSTPVGPYLPDFLLRLHVTDHGTRTPQPVLFEVKPPVTQWADGRWYYASAAAGMPLFLATGLPHPDDPIGSSTNLPDGHIQLFDGRPAGGDWWQDSGYAFCACPWCGEVGIEFAGRGARVCGPARHGEDSSKDKSYTHSHPRLLDAYAAAQGARFEHGENGVR